MVLAEAPGVGYVALYCRISQARNGRLEKVDQQERWGRSYAAKHWPGLPVQVFADNALTAADEDVERPEFNRLRECIVRGEVLHLWAVEQYRLERVEVRWFQFAQECDEGELEEVHTDRDGVIRVRDDIAGIKAVLGAGEVRRMKRRLKDHMTDLADQGRPRHGSVYGYTHGVNAQGDKTLEIEPVEAFVIRWMAESLLAGWPMAGIARTLNEFNGFRLAFGLPACLPKRAGRPMRRNGEVYAYTRLDWVGEKVRKVLTKPAVAGERVHMGQVTRKGTWEPILDEVTWRRVCAVLETPRQVEGTDGRSYKSGGRQRPARGYLYTGWLYCGRCGGRMTGRNRHTKTGPGTRRYFCNKNQANHGCGRIAIKAEPLERDVTARFLVHLQSDEFRAALADDGVTKERERIAAELSDIDAQDVKLADKWASGGLPDAAWDVARSRLKERRSKLLSDLAATPDSPDIVDPDTVVDAWDLMSPDEQRHVIGLWVARIEVGPGTPGSKVYDPSRVTIEWR
jgi:site-specific DNA recombinase